MDVFNYLCIIIFLLNTFTEIISATKVFCHYETSNGVTLDDLNDCDAIIWSITNTLDINVLDPYPGDKFCNQTNNLIEEANVKEHYIIFGEELNENDVVKLASNFELRLTFIASIVEILQNCGFTGVILDLPSTFNGTSYCNLLEELDNALEYKGLQYEVNFKGGFSIVPHNVPCTDSFLCDWSHLKHLQYVIFSGNNLGYSRTITNKARHIAPLYDTINHISLNDTLQCYITKENIPIDKLILELFAYGVSYTLLDINDSEPGAAIESIVEPIEPGLLSLNEICTLINSSGGIIHWDEVAVSPYAVIESTNEWITFENPESITAKTEWAIDNNLGGITIWKSRLDDPYGECYQKRFPLMSSIINILHNDSYNDIETTTTDNNGSSLNQTPDDTIVVDTSTESSKSDEVRNRLGNAKPDDDDDFGWFNVYPRDERLPSSHEDEVNESDDVSE